MQRFEKQTDLIKEFLNLIRNHGKLYDKTSKLKFDVEPITIKGRLYKPILVIYTEFRSIDYEEIPFTFYLKYRDQKGILHTFYNITKVPRELIQYLITYIKSL